MFIKTCKKILFIIGGAWSQWKILRANENKDWTEGKSSNILNPALARKYDIGARFLLLTLQNDSQTVLRFSMGRQSVKYKQVLEYCENFADIDANLTLIAQEVYIDWGYFGISRNNRIIFEAPFQIDYKTFIENPKMYPQHKRLAAFLKHYKYIALPALAVQSLNSIADAVRSPSDIVRPTIIGRE